MYLPGSGAVRMHAVSHRVQDLKMGCIIRNLSLNTCSELAVDASREWKPVVLVGVWVWV